MIQRLHEPLDSDLRKLAPGALDDALRSFRQVQMKRADVADASRSLLAAMLGEWPEISERSVRLYQERGIVEPARGGTRSAFYTESHVLQVIVAALASQIRCTTLEKVAARLRGVEDESLEDLVYSLVREYRRERAVGPPRPLPSVRRKIDAAPLSAAAIEQRIRYALGEGIEVSVPVGSKRLESDAFVDWVADRLRKVLSASNEPTEPDR